VPYDFAFNASNKFVCPLFQGTTSRIVPGPLTIKTRHGRVIETDLVLVATGRDYLDKGGLGKVKPEPFLTSLLPRSSLSEEGRVPVDEHMLVTGHTRVFAVGDIVGG